MTSTPTRPVDNVVITTKGLQDKSINILDGTTVENKGKLILIDILKLNILNVYLIYFRTMNKLVRVVTDVLA